MARLAEAGCDVRYHAFSIFSATPDWVRATRFPLWAAW